MSDRTDRTDGHGPGGIGANEDRTDAHRGHGIDADRARPSGRRVVLRLYGGIVGIAAAMGFLVGAIAPRGLDPRLLGVVSLPPTPLGTAAYGAITVALALGAAVGLVAAVSRYTGAATGEEGHG